jgi:hypothetical protein
MLTIRTADDFAMAAEQEQLTRNLSMRAAFERMQVADASRRVMARSLDGRMLKVSGLTLHLLGTTALIALAFGVPA